MTVYRSQGLQGTLPDGMPEEMLSYRFFASSYNWTPDQVRALDIDELTWLPLIETAVGEAERQEAAAQARVSQRKQG